MSDDDDYDFGPDAHPKLDTPEAWIFWIGWVIVVCGLYLLFTHCG